MTLQLHGWFYEKLQEALLSAYPAPGVLEQFVLFNLNKSLNEITGSNLSEQIFNLIQLEKSCGEICIQKLVDKAYEDKPLNEQVQVVKDLFEKTQKQVEFTLVLNDAVDEVNNSQAEYIAEELSKILQDPCLNKIEFDSRKIFLRSSEEGLETFKTLFDSGELAEILSYDIETLENADGNNLVPISINKRLDTLENLLAEKKWKEADEETSIILLQAAAQEERGWLQPEDIEKIDCNILFKIDDMWMDSSQNYFGFSVQKFVWEQLQEQLESNVSDTEKEREFAKQVQWCVQEKGERWIQIAKSQIVWGYDKQIRGYLPTPPPAVTGDNVIKVCVTLALVERLAKYQQQLMN
ncbi:GUN4 protein [Rivularia sp. PCC 7116]|uniref:GUN4 domain-containing protein n=1 Tax=Rivularia sp. PCC 7116 TaxID=373994 RepID=UPI00029F1821|nr:GUN4 domain-containing protein [Rivularia sp. PCC 7116]AFY53578.1 GUN4 protein [Rivularia sp. PCC 7116]